VTAHVLRELWAALLAFAMTTGCWVGLSVMTERRLVDDSLREGMWWWSPAICALLIGALFGFAFSMGRTVRGWMWAAPAAVHLTWISSGLVRDPQVSKLTLVALPAGPLFFVASALGQRKQSPRMAWLAWVSTGPMAVWWPFLGSAVWEMTGLNWFCWLVALVLERTSRAPAAPVAH